MRDHAPNRAADPTAPSHVRLAPAEPVSVSPAKPDRASPARRASRGGRASEGPRRASFARDESGFTLVEVLVAATLLIVGIFASLALLDRSTSATSASVKRDGANAIAEELVERATGSRFDVAHNDLVDRRSSSPGNDSDGRPLSTGTPAERFRRQLAPDTDPATSPITETDVAHPWLSVASWNVRRGGTTYRVGYRACTQSDIVDGVQIAGPNDCERNPTDPNDTGGNPSGVCRLGFIDPSTVYTGENQLDVRLQLFNAAGLSLCLGAVPFLGDTINGLCGGILANAGTGAAGQLLSALLGPGGFLNGLQTVLVPSDILSLNADLCPERPETDVGPSLGGFAASTRVAVTVTWREAGAERRIRQSATVRRPGTPEGL